MQNNCCIKLSAALNTGLRQFLVLDIRSHSQFSFRHLPGTVNIPFEWLNEILSSISASSNTILIGEKNPDRTAQAMELLNNYGLTRVSTLCDGLKAWSTEIHFS